MVEKGMTTGKILGRLSWIALKGNWKGIWGEEVKLQLNGKVLFVWWLKKERK